MRKLFTPLFAAILGVAALAGAAVPATAGEVTIRVSADGLDLTRATDIVAMKGRIDVAVSKACSKTEVSERFGTVAVADCVADGTAKAMAELDARVAEATAQ